MDNTTEYAEMQGATDGSTGEVQLLHDPRFDWRKKRQAAAKLAKIYQRAGYDYEAGRAASCATWLQFGETAAGSLNLRAANFCQLRLCPMCISRRARKAACQLSRIMDRVEADHSKPGVMWLFLTLTIENVTGPDLGAAYSLLTSSWDKLTRQRPVRRAIKGWFRAIETTRRGKGYHPHIHAILAVEPGYFATTNDLYIRHGDWVQRWRQALGADYDPWVRVQITRAKEEIPGKLAAAKEAAKYPIKDVEYISDDLSEWKAAEIVRDYTEALYKRRLTAMGGWMREAAQALKEDDLGEGDLVHADDQVRGDLAEWIVTYKWHLGAGDYILSSREPAPSEDGAAPPAERSGVPAPRALRRGEEAGGPPRPTGDAECRKDGSGQ